MPKLTFRQAQILKFIKAYIKENGFPPTRAEIGTAHSINPNAAQGHINLLVKKGAISVKSKTSRSIIPTKGFRVRIQQ